ncbi:MAG: YtxH domain-containing protein [Bacteroidia bacterium]|nr:YtxH domain-containing protein [Bacteroidia bacterium]MDW8135051.1 YtxH domain-containing protein [Bacteroidia bacterium]
MSDSRGSNAFWAFLAGIAVGTVVGILIAPDSGVNTRRRLRQKLAEYWDAIRGRIGDGAKSSSYEQARQKAFMESGLRPDEYKKAEQLLLEIEGLLGEVRSTTS